MVEAELRGKVGEVERRRWHLIDNWPPLPHTEMICSRKINLCVSPAIASRAFFTSSAVRSSSPAKRPLLLLLVGERTR